MVGGKSVNGRENLNSSVQLQQLDQQPALRSASGLWSRALLLSRALQEPSSGAGKLLAEGIRPLMKHLVKLRQR